MEKQRCKTHVRVLHGFLKSSRENWRYSMYIPLLYLLNKDWYHTLMYATFGKIVLAVCGVVIIITALLMMKYTRPIEYKR